MRCHDLRLLLAPKELTRMCGNCVVVRRRFLQLSAFSVTACVEMGAGAIGSGGVLELVADPDIPGMRHVSCPVGDSVVHA